MFGAIVGDIVGSVYEFQNHRAKDFPLFSAGCFPTDDSIMTLAVAQALLESRADFSDLGEQAVRWMRTVGQPYPECGYGGRFYAWMYGDCPRPYHSFGNGAAMRVSPVAYAARSLEEVKRLSRQVTEVTHDHPEGIKGAEATAVLTWLALQGADKTELAARCRADYYPLDLTLDQIRPTYRFDETCQGTVPPAVEAFLESGSFEDAIRNAISLGGDSDTLAAITGAIAGAYYGVPEEIGRTARTYLDGRLADILDRFEGRFPLERKPGERPLEVAAALIRDGERVLICRRPAHKARGLLWEFPGGKVEPGETAEEALRRECREELGVEVAIEGPCAEVTHRYPDVWIHLTCFWASLAGGVPQKLEHEDLRWAALPELAGYEFCPADRRVVERLTAAG